VFSVLIKKYVEKSIEKKSFIKIVLAMSIGLRGRRKVLNSLAES